MIRSYFGAGACSSFVGSSAHIVEAGRHRDTGASVARILKLVLAAQAPGLPSRAHEDYGHQVLVRMDKESFHLKRINNGACSTKTPGPPRTERGRRTAALDR
jgi:hypothetical protein